jgi:hypothetical protein
MKRRKLAVDINISLKRRDRNGKLTERERGKASLACYGKARVMRDGREVSQGQDETHAGNRRILWLE